MKPPVAPPPRQYVLRRRRPAFPGADCPPPRPYGPRRSLGAARRCRNCTRPVDPLTRRHLCPLCMRASQAGQLPEGACAACGTTDRRVLAVVELEAGPVVLCANDQRLLGYAVATVEDLRAELARHAEPAGGLLDELLAQVLEDAAAA